MDTSLLLLLVVCGAGLGSVITFYFLRRKEPSASAPATDAQIEALSAKVLQGVNETFRSTSEHLRAQSRADMDQRRESIEGLVKPIRDTLSKTEQKVLQGVNETFRSTSEHLRAQSRADMDQRRESIEGLVKPIRDTLSKTEQKVLQGVNETFRSTSEHLRAQSRTDMDQRRESIEGLVKPIRDALSKTEQQVREIEKERKQDLGSLKQHLEQVTRGQQQLQTETGRLVQALKKPQVRGRWGELTLRRTVELAGMVEYCDFEEQPQKTGEEGRTLRPDMIVHMPNERRVVVDAKTPLDAYLAAIEADDEAQRNELLQRHVEQVTARVKELSSKAYGKQFDDTLDFVVMFVPGEQFLAAALERDPTLHENALDRSVILATPPTLVALLRAIAYGWRQKSLEENAQEIRRLGEDLYARAATFTEHLVKTGKSLDGSVRAYNNAIGSLERNLLPGARKFTELGIQAKKEIPETRPVETGIRQIAVQPQAEDESGQNTKD